MLPLCLLLLQPPSKQQYLGLEGLRTHLQCVNGVILAGRANLLNDLATQPAGSYQGHLQLVWRALCQCSLLASCSVVGHDLIENGVPLVPDNLGDSDAWLVQLLLLLLFLRKKLKLLFPLFLKLLFLLAPIGGHRGGACVNQLLVQVMERHRVGNLQIATRVGGARIHHLLAQVLARHWVVVIKVIIQHPEQPIFPFLKGKRTTERKQ